MRELIGAILIGGRSTRMGRDKATLRMDDGRTMMDAVAEALREVCDEVAVVGGTGIEHERPGLQHVTDLRPQAGPLGGIEALLASGLASEYLICPCDLPHITADVLGKLLAHRDSGATVLRVAGSQDFEPLPARIAASALPVVQRLLDEGKRSVWQLMETLPASIVEVNVHHAGALKNINTPDDLNTA